MGTHGYFLPCDIYKIASDVLHTAVGSLIEERKIGASPAESQYDDWDLRAHACQEMLKELS